MTSSSSGRSEISDQSAVRPSARRSRLMLARLARFGVIFTVNLLVFAAVFLILEIATRTYSAVVNGKGFFRTSEFICPWITTNDYPPPLIRADGQAYFRHTTSPTPVEKPDGTIRIIAVGGSTTVNEHTFRTAGFDYPSALEERLNSIDERQFEVLNAGGDGFSTAQSLINIELRLVEFSPDYILLMHNINDCSANFFDGGATSDYSNKYLKPYFLDPSLQGSLSLPGFLAQSRFLVKLGLPKILMNKTGDLDPESPHAAGLRYFERNLATISAVCRLNGVHLIVLTQPFSGEPHPFVNITAFLDYHRATIEVTDDLGISRIDMYDLIGEQPQLFIDPFHYTVEGIEVFTDILFDEFIRIIHRDPGLHSEEIAPDHSSANLEKDALIEIG